MSDPLFSQKNAFPEVPSWIESPYAEQYMSAERPHWQQALKQLTGPKVLQVGNLLEQKVIEDIDLPQLILSDTEVSCQASRDIECDLLAADPAFLPFQAESISSVILPHILEMHALPHQVLREVHRVLIPDGCLILTGFNPHSLLGAQRRLRLKNVLEGQYYGSKRVIDWLQLLGLEVVCNAKYQYAPLTKSPRLNTGLNFINAMGSRWLPMFGGGYMITAKKREVGITLVGKVKFSPRKRRARVASPVKISLKPKS